MKKLPLFVTSFLPLLVGLSSCGNPGVSPIQLYFGTHEFISETEVTTFSHMSKLQDESYLESLINHKENFVLVVIGDAHTTCGCWLNFHKNNIVRYQKTTNVLFYYILSNELSQNYGMSIGSTKATVAIFHEGKVAFENSDADENSDFVKSYSAFQEWMNDRVVLPKVYFVSREQLSQKYSDYSDFTIYFSRQTCSDCLYLQNHAYKKWYSTHTSNVQDSFIIDMDAVGIGAIEVDGKIYRRSSDESANEYQKAAQAQYDAFKVEFGLTETEDNPVGFGSGAVPTLYHVNPQGNGKKTGEVIDMAACFFNETVDAKGVITESYFDAKHLELDALSWLTESTLEHKNLVGKSIVGEDRREGLSTYENPMVDLFLTAAVGAVK